VGPLIRTISVPTTPTRIQPTTLLLPLVTLCQLPLSRILSGGRPPRTDGRLVRLSLDGPTAANVELHQARVYSLIPTTNRQYLAEILPYVARAYVPVLCDVLEGTTYAWASRPHSAGAFVGRARHPFPRADVSASVRLHALLGRIDVGGTTDHLGIRSSPTCVYRATRTVARPYYIS